MICAHLSNSIDIQETKIDDTFSSFPNIAHITYYYHAQYSGTFPERKYYKYPN